MKKSNVMVRFTALSVLVCLLLSMLSGCGGKSGRVRETDETTFGIDVARYQGTIDWRKVAQSGVQFAVIRVGYRAQADGIIKEDPNARYNLQEASRADVGIAGGYDSGILFRHGERVRTVPQDELLDALKAEILRMVNEAG